MADGSQGNLGSSQGHGAAGSSRLAGSRELLSSADRHDAHIMNVEQTAEDHIELIAYPRGWFTISTSEGSVDLNEDTARLMAEAILKQVAASKARAA